MTLFIALFILLMQFLWKYIDDLVGKGLEWHIIGELLFYATATLVPMALPLAILLSSIMTFGNLGEHYELVAMKSSGLSLWRIMNPLIVTTVVICGVAFFFSNVVLPKANIKMGSLLFDVREQKPALQIKEGVFYNGIDGYSIRVGRKGKDGKTIYDVLIYDHTRPTYHSNTRVITAQEGRMEMSADKSYLYLTLKNGREYTEQIKGPDLKQAHPLSRTKFKEQLVTFDLSGFKLQRTDEELFKSNYQMLNLSQLNEAIDTLEAKGKRRQYELVRQIQMNYLGKADKVMKRADSLKIAPGTQGSLEDMPIQDKLRVLETATNLARASKQVVDASISESKVNRDVITRHEVEWHKKFTLSFACFVLFFIGAPLGAIIRKGGLGMPVVVSVIFFIIFHVLSITGEKFAKEGVLPAWQGMWMASAILLPLGIFLTWRATADSSLFDIDAYIGPFKRLFAKKKAGV
jgi:lipopolysaccharide export system permease protein